MMINQGSYRFAEDPETAHSNSSPAKPAVFHPPVDSPSADVQNSGCFVDTEKPLVLQCENRVHDAPPALMLSACWKKLQRLPIPSTFPHHEAVMSWSNEVSTDSVNALGKR
jgi:hypothetical protein